MRYAKTAGLDDRTLIPAWNAMKKISYPGFRKWVNDFGVALAKAALSGTLMEEVPRTTEDYTMMDTDELYDILLSVPGIGEKRAEMVIQKIIERSANDPQSEQKVGVQ